MKKLKYISIIALSAISLLSCHKGKDEIFTDPNTPGLGTAPTMLTEIEVATINSYEGDINRTSSIYVQHNVGIDGSVDAQVYAITQQEEDNNWTQLYATMVNAKLLRDNFGSKNPYYDGIAEIIMCMNIGLTTDVYGDAPFSDGLKGNGNLYPKFDAQQAILTNIQSMLDDAIVKLGKQTTDNILLPGPDDLIFGGAIDSWIKTAYTLKARYLNRLSNKSSYDPASILDALSKGISSSSEDCMGTHGGDNGQNQWFAYQHSRLGYILASATLVDSMKLRPTDLRLYYYFDSTGLGDVIGSPISPVSANASGWGPYLASSADVFTPLVTFTEAEFIEAEVKARQNDPATFTSLNNAIQTSCSKATSGVYTGADIATYTATTATLSRVMYEKWIAMFGQVEAYDDYRRTKMPVLVPNPDGAIATIPGRFPMSQQERNTNPNTVVLPISAPVWWAQ